MRENRYQRHVIERLHRSFDRVLILKNDAQLVQGMLDLTVVTDHFICFLEVKASESAPFQPNQQYYIDLLNDMGHPALVIFPENEEVVFRALHAASRDR